MIIRRGKTGYDEGETKEYKQKPRRHLDHITFNYYGEKSHYLVNIEHSTQMKLKEDSKALSNTKQG